MTEKLPKYYVGVDVSKKHLDVCIVPGNSFFRVKNTEEGISSMITKISSYCIAQVACEATGGYEGIMLDLLEKANFDTWCVEPKRIGSFKESEGVCYKTDKSDAYYIALFASQKIRGYMKVAITETQKELKLLADRCTDLVDMITRETQKMERMPCKRLQLRMKRVIEIYQDELRQTEVEIKQICQADEAMHRRLEIMQSVPGLGTTTAIKLLAYVPELGSVDHKKVAAIVGVAPYVKQSGQLKGVAHIANGRGKARKALYMPALVASRYNKDLKVFYDRLRDAGKPAKVALVAVMRKLLVLVNSLVSRNEMWKENYMLS